MDPLIYLILRGFLVVMNFSIFFNPSEQDKINFLIFLKP